MYECHVTVEPMYDEALDALKALAEPLGFKVADLLMRKRLADTPERSEFDTFLTARDEDVHDLRARRNQLLQDLEMNVVKVWRHKIEYTIEDVRTDA